MPIQDPQLDVAAEAAAGPLTTSSAWKLMETTTSQNAMSSRVVPFILGFALASLISWISSLPAIAIVATPIGYATQPAVAPVVTTSIEFTSETYVPALRSSR